MQITNLQTGEVFELLSIEHFDAYKKITVLLEGKPFVIIASNEEFETSWQ